MELHSQPQLSDWTKLKWLVGSQLPEQGLNAGPCQWKHWILTTRRPGNSQILERFNYPKTNSIPISSHCPFVPKPLHRCQFSSVAQLCPTLCDPMNRSTPGLPVHHQLPEFTQTHVHRVGDAIQPSHPLSSPSPPAFNPSQHQGLFQWVNSWHEVAKVLEFQLQHQSYQWTPRIDLL